MADAGRDEQRDGGDSAADGRSGRRSDEEPRTARRTDLTRELRRAALLHRRSLLAKVRPRG